MWILFYFQIECRNNHERWHLRQDVNTPKVLTASMLSTENGFSRSISQLVHQRWISIGFILGFASWINVEFTTLFERYRFSTWNQRSNLVFCCWYQLNWSRLLCSIVDPYSGSYMCLWSLLYLLGDVHVFFFFRFPPHFKNHIPVYS